MAQEMNQVIRTEYLTLLMAKYQKADKSEKTKILNEVVADSGMNRKSVIRLLNQNDREKKEIKTVGRKRRYDDLQFLSYVKKISKIMNHPCSRRLKPALVSFIPFYEDEYGKLSKNVKELIIKVSPRTLDRIFARHFPHRLKKGFCTTRPGSMIRKEVPLRNNQWDKNKPGYFEVDTVAHCGGSMLGSFVYSLNFVDIATSWTISRATWGKGQTGVFKAITDIIDTLPFKIRGFHSDNGSEFMNNLVISFFKKRKRSISQTRSREYIKNDNPHIESKNWSITRQYFGYERFDDPKITGIMNEIFVNEFYLFLNFFVPSAKLLSKERIASKTVKKYDTCKTPFQRVLENNYIPAKIKKELYNIYNNLKPFSLQKKITKNINTINSLASPYFSAKNEL